MTNHISVEEDVDWVLHFASPASPMRLSRPTRSTRSRSARSGRSTRSGSRRPRAPGSCSPRRPRCTATRWSIHSRRSTGATSTPSGPAASTTRPSGTRRRWRWPIYRTHGVPVKIARIFNTYGPRLRRDDGRAVPTFIDQALHGRPLTVHGDGSQTRSLCYVDDLVEGLWRLLVSDVVGDARQPRQPGGGQGPRPREDDRAPRRAADPTWSSRSAPSTTPRSAARTSLGRGPCSAGRRRRPGRRPGAHDRVGPEGWPA